MKSFRIAMLLAIFAVTFSSCKKTNTGEPPAPEPKPVDHLTASEWKGDSLKTTATISPQANQKQAIAAARVTFNKDKTFTGKLFEASSPASGTWELQTNDTKIKLTGGFQAELENIIDAVLDGLAGSLPAGITNLTFAVPEIYDILALTDKKMVIKGAINVNYRLLGFPQTTPINVEVSFKR